MFTSFGKAELQILVEHSFPSLIERLDHLLPLLPTEGRNFDLGNKRVLAELASSFLESDFLKHKDSCRQVLLRLPQAKLNLVASALGIAVGTSSFEITVKGVLKCPWLAIAEALREHAGLPGRFADAPKQPQAHVESVPVPSANKPVMVTEPFKTLLDYQFEVFLDSQKLLSIPRNRLILQMPTGSGKTRTAMELINTSIDECSHADPIVIWIAHSSELCDQAIDCYLATRQHVGRRETSLFRFWGSAPPNLLPDGPVFVVTTYQKMCALQRDPATLHILRKRAILVVTDEAHIAVAPQFGEAVLSVLGDRARLVGLTATPVRRDDAGTQLLRERFLDQLVSIAESDDGNAFEELQKRNILARPLFQFLQSPSTFQLTPSQLKILEDELDFPEGFLRKIGMDDLRNALILKTIHEHAKDGRSIIVFGCSVEHSRFLASTLLFLGIKAAHLDGTSDRGVRVSVVEGFRSGRIKVLCNFGLLTTGFDAPNTDEVFITRPTASPILYAQMVGRGLRGPRLGGKAICHVTDVLDNFTSHGNLLSLYQRFKEEWIPTQQD